MLYHANSVHEHWMSLPTSFRILLLICEICNVWATDSCRKCQSLNVEIIRLCGGHANSVDQKSMLVTKDLSRNKEIEKFQVVNSGKVLANNQTTEPSSSRLQNSSRPRLKRLGSELQSQHAVLRQKRAQLNSSTSASPSRPAKNFSATGRDHEHKDRISEPVYSEPVSMDSVKPSDNVWPDSLLSLRRGQLFRSSASSSTSTRDSRASSADSDSFSSPPVSQPSSSPASETKAFSMSLLPITQPPATGSASAGPSSTIGKSRPGGTAPTAASRAAPPGLDRPASAAMLRPAYGAAEEYCDTRPMVCKEFQEKGHCRFESCS
jgi:hypothetical protein